MEHGACSRTSDSHETHEGATAASAIRSERLDVNAMFEEIFEVCDMRDCTQNGASNRFRCIVLCGHARFLVSQFQHLHNNLHHGVFANTR